MKRALFVLMFGMAMAKGWHIMAADDPPTKRLTPEERKKLAVECDNLKRSGVERFQANKLAEAGETFEKALAITRQLYPQAEFPGGHPDLADNLYNFARLLQEIGKYKDAEPYLREAAGIEKTLYSKDKFPRGHPYVARSLNSLAAGFQDEGRCVEAESLFREVLEINKGLYPKDRFPFGHPDLARSMNNLSAAYDSQGRYTEALALLRDVLDMQKKLYSKRMFPNGHPDLARSLSNLGTELASQGQSVEAEPFLKDALDMQTRLYTKNMFPAGHPEIAITMDSLGSMYEKCGRYADAEKAFRDALRMQQVLYPKSDYPSGHPDLALGLHSLARALDNQGKLEEAESLYGDALEMQKRLYPKDKFPAGHPELARTLRNLAAVVGSLGRYTDSEVFLRDAIKIQKQLYPKDRFPHGHLELALSLGILADLLNAQGKYADADLYYREVYDMFNWLYPKHKFPDGHPDLAKSLGHIAAVTSQQRKYAEAELLFRDYLKMHRQSLAAYASRVSEGYALTLFATVPGPLGEYLSNAQLLKSEPSTVYREVFASKAMITRMFEHKQLTARASADRRATPILVELMDSRRRYAELLLAPNLADPATRKKRDLDLKGLIDKIAKLDRDLRPLLPAVVQAEKTASATPPDLQKEMPADAAVVDFLHYNLVEQDPKKPGKEGKKSTSAYLAFVISKDKVAMVDLGPAKPIENAVASWRESIQLGKHIPSELPAKVRELVWAKVRKQFPDKVKTVYVSPDLALCRVPWAALPGDEPKTILLEDHAVAVIPHAVFLLDKLWPQAPQPNRPDGVLAVGGAAYDAELSVSDKVALNRSPPLFRPPSTIKWPPLPWAAAEANGVASAAAKRRINSQTLGSKEATASAILTALPKVRYAHFATHGFFADPSFRSAFQVDPKLFEMTQHGERVGAGALSPLVMTGLVFAGANNPNTPGRGVVTGEALIDLDLSGLDLAVLSACESGLGDVAGGEGAFGLQRAFHMAGAANVVASLWKVPDQSTAALMGEFYRNLWDHEKPLPPIEALRKAQLEIYRHPERIPKLANGFRGTFKEVPGTGEDAAKPELDGKTHPRLWAAFTLSGPGR